MFFIYTFTLQHNKCKTQVITEESKKLGFDIKTESFNLASKSMDELDKELKNIDDKFDKKYESLSADRKEKYNAYFEILKDDREYTKKKIDESENAEDRAKWIEHYFRLSIQFQVLYESSEKKAEKKEIELKKEEKSDKRGRIIMKVAKVIVPIAVVGITRWIEYKMDGRNSKLKITTNTPKLP